MARRRMIEVSISYDKVFNSLSEFAQLVFLKTLPHTDDYGRFDGDPQTLKARIDPLSTKHVSKYEKAMQEIAASGLWHWYITPKGKVIQYKQETFERINAFLIKQRGNAEYLEHMESYESICSHIIYKVESNKQRVISKEQKDRANSVEEIIEFCSELKLPQTDAEFLWHKWEGNGWKNNGKAIQDWRATIRSWQKAGYLPSQRNEKNYGRTKNKSGNSNSQVSRAEFSHSEADAKRFAELEATLAHADRERNKRA